MSDLRKLIRQKPEKRREPRSRKIKVDFDTLPAVVTEEGTFRVKLKGRVFMERTLDGKTAIHSGFISNIDGTIVSVWDETRKQMYGFDLKEPLPKIRAADIDQFVAVIQEEPPCPAT